MLEVFGLEEERFRFEWVSASEGPRFTKIAEEMTKTLKELEPNPYRNE
jgi:F420-non-reducing hydrogenase iron-sulfur subunit